MIGRKAVWGFVLACAVFWMTASCFADAQNDLRQAQQYEKAGRFTEAESVYKSTVAGSPGTEQAYKAQERLVMAYILAGRNGSAATELDKLKKDFSNHKDLADSLYWIARRYNKSERFDEASALFTEITSKYPNSVYAKKVTLNAPTTKILKLISNGNYSEAEAETNKLISQFKGNEGLPEALYDAARRFKEKGQFSRAQTLYQYILDNHAGCSYTNNCTMDVHKMTMCNAIKAGDFATIDREFDYLIKTYADSDMDVETALYQTAIRCEWAKQYDKAKELHQRIIQTFANSEVASQSRLDLDKCDILNLMKAGKNGDALNAVDNLAGKFSKNTYLPVAISKGIALQCYKDAESLAQQGNTGGANEQYQLAANMWEKVVNLGGDRQITAQACLKAGDCYSELKNPLKANQFYQRFVNDYPMYTLRWHALSMLALNYQVLGKDGGLAKSEADSKTRAVYQQLVEQYPDCKAARSAVKWLNSHN